MSTTTLASPSPSIGLGASDDPRVTQRRVIRSEWIKLRSVRSTVITLGLVAVVVIALGVLISIFSSGTGPGGTIRDPTGNSLVGTNIAQLVLGVLGALLVTTEYSTGMIRATFTAVPKRLPVLWAKVAVFATATFLLMLGSVLTAFLVGQALYGGAGHGASLADPGVARALLGAAFYPTGIAVMGMALGALLRKTATAIGVLFGALFLAPVIIQSLGGSWGDLAAYLPSNAGQAITSVVHSSDLLSPAAGFAVLVCWAGALLAGAAVLMRRRDA